MLINKTNPVLGLSFHGKRPWILVSFGNGQIKIWDYHRNTMIYTFQEHSGPVRSVHFHSLSESMFVSGGDDNKIKVWNYQSNRSLFTLTGHEGCVSTVEFHLIEPWIITASDDCSVRIWNWYSRRCICKLIGHRAPVTCASFNYSKHLVVSASVDQTVRVWDISALVNETLSQAGDILSLSHVHMLAGHSGRVIWALFHPILPQIISGADDGEVRIWTMRDPKSWEVYTLRGHFNSVACYISYSRQVIILSTSVDKRIQLWDATAGTVLKDLPWSHGRFGILSSHPERNLLAAGNDRGMVVFKLERERPAFTVCGDTVLYVKDDWLRRFNFSNLGNVRLIRIGRPDSKRLNQGPLTLSHTSGRTGEAILCSHMDGSSYELYTVDESSGDRFDINPMRGSGDSAAVFVSLNRFVVLEKRNNQVIVKNLKNTTITKITLPISTNAIFYAGTRLLLCRAEDKLFIFNLVQQKVLGELQTSFLKYAAWSADMDSVALLSKHSIVIADKKLVRRCSLHETVRIKSGAWHDDYGVFIYATLSHIKYCLPNGDSGILRILDDPLYITKIHGNRIFGLGRDGKNRKIIIDPTEYVLKLFRGPEVALHFVMDERTRFKLAIESGNIPIAVNSAEKIDGKDYWSKLGVEALRQGHTGVAEYAYQKTKNIERLSFLYLISGNLENLNKMMMIEEDVESQFHDALYIGDIEGRIKILEDANHLPLAYMTAKVHGLHEAAKRIAANMKEVPSLPQGKSASLLLPPKPIVRGWDWPLLGGEWPLSAVEQMDYEDADWVEDLDLPQSASQGSLQQFSDVDNLEILGPSFRCRLCNREMQNANLLKSHFLSAHEHELHEVHEMVKEKLAVRSLNAPTRMFDGLDKEEFQPVDGPLLAARAKAQYEMHLKEMEAVKDRMPAVWDQGEGSAIKDIHMKNFNVSVGGRDLIVHGTITLAKGRHYGLVGRNGTGKTTFLRAMALHAIEGIPNNCQILHVEQEVVGDNTTALQCVLNSDTKRTRLLEEEASLTELQRQLDLAKETGQTFEKLDGNIDESEIAPRLEQIYKTLEDIDARAATILKGLGFTSEMQKNPTKDFDRGWRMILALGRALFIEPDLLLLDEPVSHLDLDAVLWLGKYLTEWPKTLIVVSHAREFLNTAVTDIIHLQGQKLTTYNGDYDTFEMEHIQPLERMARVDETINDSDYKFEFPLPDDRPGPPIIRFSNASFGYPGGPLLFEQLNFEINLNSRISMVGPKMSGKSTMLKLISGELQPTTGTVSRSAKVRMAVFSQYHIDGLDPTSNPLLYMMHCFPGVSEEKLRRHLSSFGITENLALQPMYTLSSSEKTRVVFSQITFYKPHVLLLDEPSNHFDLDAVEALIEGLNLFRGGIFMVSCNEHLISWIADEVWAVSGGRVNSLSGTV